MIYLLVGDIRTGKTTSIYNAVIKRDDVGGFLTPDVDGTRMLYDIASRKRYPFQVDFGSSDQTIKVGRFNFLSSAFDKGREIIFDQLNSASVLYLIIDEVGKLELEDQGFHSLVNILMEKKIDKDVILVVRSFLVEEVVNKYQLRNHKIINDINLVL
ncbi:MAG: hypothetical protein HKN68_00660 [Saprospiraceae bacterium]|nr:hypothetical protein [Saprospiraceae bacterium]